MRQTVWQIIRMNAYDRTAKGTGKMALTFQIFIGLSAGFLAAGGVAALLIGLGVLVRFVRITHTASRSLLYEKMIFWGTLCGNFLTIFRFQWGVHELILVPAGLFLGIFVGGWILALAEVLRVIPVYCRKFGIQKEMRWIVILLSGGKVCGSLFYFYRGWGG